MVENELKCRIFSVLSFWYQVEVTDRQALRICMIQTFILTKYGNNSKKHINKEIRAKIRFSLGLTKYHATKTFPMSK